MLRPSLGLAAAMAGAAVAAQAAGVVDDRGIAIELAAPAQRIVALAPSITELVYAAGAGDRLVGAARYSDYPESARAVPRIGDASRIDLERVVSLKPDLILGWESGNPAADIERLERLGFKLFVAEPATLDSIPRLLRTIGTLAGTGAIAGAAAQEFGRGVADLRTRYSARATVRAFYEIWHDPLMTVNGRHIISDVLRLCGGANVFAGAASLTPVVSLESVIAARPQVVIGGSSATTPQELAEQWRGYSRYFGLRGVQARYVDPDLIQRQTPRILEGARNICEELDAVRADTTARR